MDVNSYELAAKKLFDYLSKKHWDGNVLIGPDPIGKIHWRITRFVRSYIPWLPGDDRYVYLQGQAYWIKANLLLYQFTEESGYMDLVNACASAVVERQPSDGAWRHPPIRWRKGFISTVEGVWASLGLIAAYRESGKPFYLEAALKWYDFQINQIGFQSVGGGLAVNYYSHSKSKVPNVTTMMLWLAAELFQVTNDIQFLDKTTGMLQFIEYCQIDTGELPYSYPNRIHFMCYQYNAFQFIDLANYYQLTGNEKCGRILKKLSAFLATGLSENSHCRYSCSKDAPEVNYWTAVLAASLRRASELGLGNYLSLSEKAYCYLLTRQRPDGGFNFSEHNYGLLTDRRSYPRYLAMLLYFLLYRAYVDFRQNESDIPTEPF